ncbi:MAG: LytR/AlgR family response regulator transcription factor [Christensenellales bacterium]
MEALLRIAVYEDMAEDAEELLRCILEGGIPAEYKTFTSGEALLNSFAAERYDLIFLDIYMGGKQEGITVAAKIREMDASVTLAFTTSSKEHALESYRLKVYAYLEKPVHPADVQDVLKQALRKQRDAPSVRLLIEGMHREIPLDSILYFEQKNQSVMVCTLTETLRASQTVKLKDIETMLPDTQFLRCHHSYIANLRYIKEPDWELRIFLMQNGGTVYIRRQDIKRAKKAYEDSPFCKARGVKDEA